MGGVRSFRERSRNQREVPRLLIELGQQTLDRADLPLFEERRAALVAQPRGHGVQRQMIPFVIEVKRRGGLLPPPGGAQPSFE